MPTRVNMPQLGESVVEGTITKWLKREGEPVSELEPLVEINTDKVDTEIPAPASGKLLKVYVGEGTTVRAGTLLAVIGREGETAPAVEEVAAAAPARAVSAPTPQTGPVGQPVPARDLGFISPVVAKIAAEQKVDLSQVKGTGSGGRITKKDVLAHLEARPGTAAAAEVPAWERPGEGDLFRPTELQFPSRVQAPARPPASAQPTPGSVRGPGADEVVPLSPVRRQIAEHMLRSKTVSPHVTTLMEVDMSAVVAHREAHKGQFERDGVNLTFTAYFVLAAVEALKSNPEVNSSWTEAGIQFHRAVNIGVAVSMGPEGLIVPVIRDADQKSLLRIAAEVSDMARRARAHQLKPEEVRGGTFTLTNHGVTGSLLATPIISQPQCAILGVGAIQKRVVVVNDAIAIRPMVYLTLTFDHRILDGARADAFLAKVVEALQKANF